MISATSPTYATSVLSLASSFLIILLYFRYHELRTRTSRLLLATAVVDIAISFSWLLRDFICPYMLATIGHALYLLSSFLTSCMAIDGFISLTKKHLLKRKLRLELYYYIGSSLATFILISGYLISIRPYVDLGSCPSTTDRLNVNIIAKYEIYFAYIPIPFVAIIVTGLTLYAFKRSEASSFSSSSLSESMISVHDEEQDATPMDIRSSSASPSSSSPLQQPTYVQQSRLDVRRKLRYVSYLIPVCTIWIIPFTDTLLTALNRTDPTLVFVHSVIGPLVGFMNALLFSLSETVVSPKSSKEMATNAVAEPYFRRYLIRVYAIESLDFLLEAWSILKAFAEFQDRQSAVERYIRLSSNYVESGSAHEINLSSDLRTKLLKEVEQVKLSGPQEKVDLAMLSLSCSAAEALLDSNSLSLFQASNEFRQMIDALQNAVTKDGIGRRNVFAELSRDLFSANKKTKTARQ